MTRWIVVGLVVALAAAALGFSATALAQESPAVKSGPMRIVAPTNAVTPPQFRDLIAETTVWAKWACILAGLALVAAVKVSWSVGTVARNQAKLAKVVEDIGGK